MVEVPLQPHAFPELPILKQWWDGQRTSGVTQDYDVGEFARLENDAAISPDLFSLWAYERDPGEDDVVKLSLDGQAMRWRDVKRRYKSGARRDYGAVLHAVFERVLFRAGAVKPLAEISMDEGIREALYYAVLRQDAELADRLDTQLGDAVGSGSCNAHEAINVAIIRLQHEDPVLVRRVGGAMKAAMAFELKRRVERSRLRRRWTCLSPSRRDVMRRPF